MARSRRRPRRSNAFIGLLAVAVIAIIMYFGFTKDVPLKSGFQLRAQFQSANSIRPNSPVRIAGVEVGKVKAVEPVEGSNDALLVMELDDSALPLHENATAKIRPRIFLEGNFFVDLKPGTPDSPQLDSGDTIAVTQTASPVQLDEVLTSLQSDSREDLQQILTGLNSALMSDIARESSQQAAAIEEVTVAVRQMDEMTQHNAALVEETNAAIEQTEARANELDKIVEVFRLNETNDWAETASSLRSAPRKPVPARPAQTKPAKAAYLSQGNAAIAADWSEF